jgi:serine protease Do
MKLIDFLRRRSKLLITLAILIFLTALGVWGYRYRKEIATYIVNSFASVEIRTSQKILTQEEAVVAVVDAASPAVVSVIQETTVYDLFSGPISQQQGIGTGFIIAADGIILTNRHVVSDKSATYTVVTTAGEEYAAQEIHRDFVYDLAIIKITASGLPVLTLGDSDTVRVGQTAVAIGNALGRFSNTVTTGVISGVGRGIEASSGSQSTYMEDIIQTDAALNPGNSGGPLLNLSAEVVGINVAIAASSDNIGFSIPINIAKPVVVGFKEYGRIIRPFLGVTYYVITEDLAALRDLPQGAFIQAVAADSGADEAGVEAGDIITAIDGQQISGQTTLAAIVVSHEVGDTVTLSINRDGEELTLEATLTEAPSD